MEKKPNCIIEQWDIQTGEHGFEVVHNVEEDYEPFFDVTAITKVYLRPEYLQTLHDEMQDSYL